MGARIDADGIRIQKSGRIWFDSRDKLLHGNTWGFPISGSRAIGALSSPHNASTIYDLGASPDGHTLVYGACKFNLNNNAAGLAFNRWHAVMGGTIVWVMDGEPGIRDFLGENGLFSQFVGYYFRVNSGRVELVRRAWLKPTPLDYSVLPHTISYKLRTGMFT
jgi:hypothetical protein